MYLYARENLAKVHIYIQAPVVTKIVRDQRIPIIWFVANCGGILGLCMGFSIVTVFEVLHSLATMLAQGRRNGLQRARVDSLAPREMQIFEPISFVL